MAASLVQPPARPVIQPNVTTIIEMAADYSVAVGEVRYMETEHTLFRNFGLQDQRPALLNAGSLWTIRSGEASILHTYNFGPIFNSGLMAAESTTRWAQTIRVESSWYGGLTNSGGIFALAPNGDAIAVNDWASGVSILNSGLIAALGARAVALSRNNGGTVVNEAGGSILAEGQDAIAVYMGRGQYSGTTPSGDPFWGPPSVVNHGSIVASRTEGNVASVGLFLTGGSSETVVVVNTGLIRADYAIYATGAGFSPPAQNPQWIINEASGVLQGNVYLGAGADILTNRGEIDGHIIGGEGNDGITNLGSIKGDVYLDEGNDIFDGTQGAFSGAADLGWGEDIFLGGSSVERAAGGRGADRLSGGLGADLLLGGRGDDHIDGGGDADRLYGEFGNDVLISQGGDFVDGGSGDDAVVLRDYTFASASGGAGGDWLILPGDARVIDLSMVLASGRVQAFEAIELAGAETLVVRAEDVAALTGGSRLMIRAGAAGTVALTGSWTAGASQTLNGVTYNVWQLGGAEVLVAGVGSATVSATPPAGVTGLDAVAGGAVAPLPGAGSGAFLTQSVTQVENFDLRNNLVIDADETWISNSGSGYAPIYTYYGTDSLINHGRIESIGGARGAVAINTHYFGDIRNHGAMIASASGNADDLQANRTSLNTYGLYSVSQNGAGNVHVFFSGNGIDSFHNGGLMSASSEAGMAIGYQAWGSADTRNSGEIRVSSSAFISAAIILQNGGNFHNTGRISASGDLGAYGIATTTHVMRLVNDGEIMAESRTGQSVGVNIHSQINRATILNSGLIEADVAIRSGMTLNGGALDLHNTGVIAGDIHLNDNPYGGPAQSDLVFNGGSITGVVRLGGANDIFFGLGGVQKGEIRGEDGTDFLGGGAGDDALSGGAGTDLLFGAAGADRLSGGAGVDVFLYRNASDSVAGQADSILDFETGIDRIDLGGLGVMSIQIGAVQGGSQLTVQLASGAVMTIGVQGSVALGDIVVEPSAVLTLPPTGGVLLALASGSMLQGGVGMDVLVGLGGDDTLSGGAGADHMLGGMGNDTYHVSDEGDLVWEASGGGIDTVIADIPHFYGWNLDEDFENLVLLQGESGYGNGLDNHMTGNSGGNRLDGLGGDDRLFGMGGWDRLYGHEGNDLLDGGDGDDLLYSSIGFDTVAGGAGNDTLITWDGPFGVIVHLGWQWMRDGWGHSDLVSGIETVDGTPFDDVLISGPAGETLYGAEGNDWIEDAGGGNDTLYGNSGVDAVLGGDGDDTLNGGGGDDGVIGGAGNDLLRGDETEWYSTPGGSDWLDGGDGDDVAYGSVGADVVIGGAGNDTLHGEDGNDTVVGDAGDDVLNGGEGDDWLEGWSGADTLNGGAGNDALFGGAGANIYNGGDGDDGLIGGGDGETMNGGSGADWLQGWGGADQLTGGTGGDSFVYTTNQDSLTTAMDRILDFNRAEGDVIRLVDVDANWLVDGDQAFTIVGAFSNTAGQMTAAYNAGTNLTLLSFDMNGDSLADMAIEVVGNVTGAENFFL